jgi:AraC-like DNA-binding protein
MSIPANFFIRRNNRVTMTKQPSTNEPFKGIFMIFKRQFLRDYFQKVDKHKLPAERMKKLQSVLSIDNNINIDSLFHSLLPYFNKADVPPTELMELKMQEGIISLLNTDKSFYQYLFDFNEPWKIDIMEYLEQNFTYELSIEEIAAFTGRSLATFKRDFKKISSIPPQQWLIQRRLKEAYEKIRVEGKRVKDVYFEVGFKNQSHFSLAFKKQYGFPPGR